MSNLQIKNALIIPAIFVAIYSCNQRPTNEKDQQMSEESAEMKNNTEAETEDWIVLFDGTSMNQWHGYNNGSEMYPEWVIKDSAMVFTPDGERGKNIVTNETFTNFILSLEWKISKGGNSGIFWSVYEDAKYDEAYLTGPEIQVLDNESRPEVKTEEKLHQAGALYDMIAPSADVARPAGEWNTCVITVDHAKNYGAVELNGTQVLEFPVHGPEWDAMVANSKFADWEGFGKYQTGKIGLQDHDNVVSYRNIKVKRLLEKKI